VRAEKCKKIRSTRLSPLTDQDPYDYETAGKGGNRFATILLYMSDLAEDAGGETVFSEAPPFGETELRPVNEVVRELRQSESLGVLEPNSWEETMTAKCRSRLSVKPYKSRAVLFYSQQPNGEPDKKSMHGGCPVLDGTKW
jgi:prolyl 4-hydroxylase